MRAQNPIDCLPSKYPRFANRAFVECFVHQRLQRRAQPVMRRNIEAFFAARQHRTRKFVLHQLAQNELERTAPDLEIFRQRGGEFHDPVIQKRRPHLQRVGHAHAVAFIQDIVRQVTQLVDPEKPVQIAVRLARFRQRTPRTQLARNQRTPLVRAECSVPIKVRTHQIGRAHV